MVKAKLCFLLPLLLASIFLSNHLVKCDEEDDIFRSINDYRKSLNLTELRENKDAECLAEEIADKFKNQPCTNTTGSNTVSGAEPQFSDFPNLLTKCRLDISNMRDGAIMPACVPDHIPSLVLTNFTQSQYSGKLKDSNYVGMGIGSDDNWVVVILTTGTPQGNFEEAPKNTASLVYKNGLISHFLLLMLLPLLLL